MALPFFYFPDPGEQKLLQLDEANSRHLVSVLRMASGEQLHLTDGAGNLFTASLLDDHKKKATVQVLSKEFIPRQGAEVSIAISLLKNVSRLEWFLEKATEMGVAKIIPLVCQRTEKQHFRLDRMQQILVSAMLQSQQVWLPAMEEPKSYNKFVESPFNGKKWIAHCLETDRKSLREQGPAMDNQLLLVGPEGDFSEAEIELALQHGYVPVTLGETRLRAETAGVVGACLLCVK